MDKLRSQTGKQTGDLVRNLLTDEEGRIVRIVNRSEITHPRMAADPAVDVLAYVVSIPATPSRPATEALWFPHELDLKKKKNGKGY